MNNMMKYVKVLEDTGFTKNQSVKQLEVMADIMHENLATKTDLKEVRVALKTNIDNVRTELQADINDVRSEMKAGFRLVDEKLKTLENKIILKMIPAMMLCLGIMSAFQKYFL